MKIRHLPFAIALLALLACLQASTAGAAIPPDISLQQLAEAGLEEDGLMLQDDMEATPRPDLRVLVAAPRAAVIGKASSVLPAMRPGRVLNVEEGETVRFLGGVREAVWYRGSGLVESSLALSGRTGAGAAAGLGSDAIQLPGKAPGIDRGLTRVDVTFDSAGEHQVAATVRIGVRPRRGRPRGASRTEGYLVRVHAPGVLGSISGFVGREADGSPLAGHPVVAVSAASGEVVHGGRTGCDGLYRIDRLPPGAYLVAVPPVRGFAREFFDDSMDAAGASPVELQPGDDAGAVDFLLARP